eukprot:CAMPEP_0181327550 /NCGR_PEP_ID=MMETSP1101-20121128/22170_1 /TAXON_ID=46948 /ORGANISM="Rhodomonas abbreviata, Strain Caron Lab Isolate" /LENGTH=258 /DNA_ID=CAMNT_0023436235 /DNA_START=9 /DNA_END=782 /DNA_ORIENTATION=+
MAMLDMFADGDPVVEWQTSLTDKDAKEQEIEVMGVRFLMKQEPQPLDGDETFAGLRTSTIGTGNIVWDGSMSAVKLLEASERTGDPALAKGSLSGKKCLELGSGCAGLGGLACALLGPAKVVVSDVASLTPLLRANVQSFLAAAGDRPGLCKDIEVLDLEWGKEEDMKGAAAVGPFDFVVCNDLLYGVDNIELIGATLEPLLHAASVILFVDSTFSYATEKAIASFVKRRELVSRPISTACLDAKDRHEGIKATVVEW